jgi:transposase-like protein
MEEDTVVGLPRPGGTVEDDPLLCVLRDGARQMLMQAIEAEVTAFLVAHADQVDERGRRRMLRHGHAPKRVIQIGGIEVQRPRVRDRGARGASRIRFTSAVLLAYLRRAKNIEELLPWLYLKGVSTGQFADALAVLLGPDAPGLSAATIRRLVSAWQDEHRRWQGRDLRAKRYVYVWADGVYFTPRLEHDRQCMLVLIGADASGKKELLAIDDGFRESEQSWHELLIRLRDENGLALDPELATGDGALGFWKAASKVWPNVHQQRCWVHKTGNVLNYLPSRRTGKPRPTSMASTKPKAAPMPRRRAIVSSPSIKRNTTRLPTVWPRIARLCSSSTTSRPSTDAHPDRQPDRERLRHRAAAHRQDQALPLACDRACHGIQTCQVSRAARRRLNGSERLGEIVCGVRFRNGEPTAAAEDQAAA